MSSTKLLSCLHCGRNNFKSHRGLDQHLASSGTCSYLARAARRQLHRLTLRQAALQLGNYEQNLGAGPMYDSDSDILRADNQENLSSSEDELSDNDDVCHIVSMQDDDSWGIPVSEDDELDLTDPAQRWLHKHRAYVRRSVLEHKPFTDDEERTLDLMLMLRRKGCPLDTVDQVMEWHLRQTGKLSDWMRLGDCREFISRKVMFKRLKERYGVPPDYFKKTRVTLPHSKAKLDLITFDAGDRVGELLTDPRFSDKDFLHYNNDPLAGPPDGELEYLADINTGRAYIHTHKQRITKKNQMLVPIIIYIDGTVTGQFDKLPVTAVKMSLGIFTNEARSRPEAWRIIGYIPAKHHVELSKAEEAFRETEHDAVNNLRKLGFDEEDLNSDEEDGEENQAWEKKFEQSTHKSQDYHRIMATMLRSVKDLCEEGRVQDFKFAGKLYKNLELVFYVSNFKLDTDEADKITGRYGSRGHGIKSICRYCCIPTSQLDFTKLPPGTKYKLPSVIGPLADRAIRKVGEAEAKLKALSQQPIRNPTYDLQFGLHNNRGVHGATPMEMLHQVLLGLFPMIRKVFLQQIGGKESDKAKHINDYAKLYGRYLTRQSERDFPKTSFSKGIFEARMTGKEMTGILLIMAAVLQSGNGRALLRKNGKKSGLGEECSIDDWVLLVELYLEYEAYLKLPRMKMSIVKRMPKKNTFMLALTKNVAPRDDGMGFKVMKFHAVNHQVQDMLDFGVPSNVDTGPNEQHHGPTKQASKMTQKDATTFEEQLANRNEELQLLELAEAEIKEGLVPWEYYLVDQKRGLSKNEPKPVATEATYLCGAQLHLVELDDGEHGLEFVRHIDAFIQYDRRLCDFLLGLQVRLKGHGLVDNLEIRTECRRKTIPYRAHPNYRKMGAWHDWAEIDWGDHGILPAEIRCFVNLSRMPEFFLYYADCRIERGLYAVVESATYESEPDKNKVGVSELFKPLTKDVIWVDGEVGGEYNPKYYLVPVESIVGPLCVIPDIGPDKTRYFRVLPRRKWAALYEEWVAAPHKHDEEQMESWPEDEETSSEQDETDSDEDETGTEDED